MPGLCLELTQRPAYPQNSRRRHGSAARHATNSGSNRVSLWRPPSLRQIASGSGGFRLEQIVPEASRHCRSRFRAISFAVPPSIPRRPANQQPALRPGRLRRAGRFVRPAGDCVPWRGCRARRPGEGLSSSSTGSPAVSGWMRQAGDSAPFVIADEGRSMKKEMLVNALQPEESRIAIVENGVLEELYIERNSLENFVGNIYKGRVVNIEPSIQAAFVDFGVGRNGFLHVSDVEYQYYKHLTGPGGPLPPVPTTMTTKKTNARSAARNASTSAASATSPPFRRSSSGAAKSWCRSSKRGSAPRARRFPRTSAFPADIWCSCPACSAWGSAARSPTKRPAASCARPSKQLKPPSGLGFIIRTAGIERSQKDLQRDLNYLLRLWKVIVRRIKKTRAPVDIYQESDMVIRTIRDIYNAEIETIWIDEPETFERAREFLKVVLPRHANRHPVVRGQRADLSQVPHRRRDHPHSAAARAAVGGGSLVIDQTEALVAIDVNSGNFRADNDAEETAYQMNLRAAAEICRQIRLRDLGGVIVNDFIDMREERHRRGVERALARRHPPRSGPLEDPANQPVRPDRDDPPANSPVAAPQRLRRLPLLPRDGPGQDGRKRGDRGRAAAAQLGAPRKRLENHGRSARPGRHVPQ